MSDAPFNPDWRSPPGDTMRDLLLEQGTETPAFAAAVGLRISEAKRLLRGELPIDGALAKKLGAYFGCSPEFWLAREADYRKPLPPPQRTSETSKP